MKVRSIQVTWPTPVVEGMFLGIHAVDGEEIVLADDYVAACRGCGKRYAVRLEVRLTPMEGGRNEAS